MSSLTEREFMLMEEFIASFAELDEMTANEHSIAWQLASGDFDQYGNKRWQPAKTETDKMCLEPICGKLPARFPPLFELLMLSYRWAEVDLQSYRLLPNPPGPDLTGWLGETSKDAFLWSHLLKAGFIQFGKGPDIDYDPVCFDLGSRKKNRDCRVVKIDHEEILCRDRVKVVSELAPSFEQLVRDTIERAQQ